MSSVSNVPPPYPYGVYAAGKDSDRCVIHLRPHECSLMPTSDEERLRESLVGKDIVDGVIVEMRGERRYVIVRLQRGTPTVVGEKKLWQCIQQLFPSHMRMVTA